MTEFVLNIRRRMLGEHSAYCLGGPISMTQCEKCEHAKAWELLNELPNDEFQLHKAGMNRINESRCAVSNGVSKIPIDILKKK